MNEENKPLLDAHYKELDTLMTKLRDPLNNKVTKAKFNITRKEPDPTQQILQLESPMSRHG